VLEAGALIAVEACPTQFARPSLREYALRSAREAARYHAIRQSIGPAGGDNRRALLADSVRDKALRHATNAIRAAGLPNARAPVHVALDGLASRDPAQRASALETLETLAEPAIIRPLLPLWEERETPASPPEEWLLPLLKDADAWLRTCAALAASGLEQPAIRAALEQLAESDPDPLARETASVAVKGQESMETLPTLSIMDRILFLRRVSLFADLSPADLKRVASIAAERYYGDGEIIAEQDEPGDEMYVIVSGEVQVLLADDGQETEIARRKAGDAVGEMSIIGQEPRVATLAAAGDVRVLVIEQKQFEGILRERPETGLAVMRVLIARLKELQSALGSELQPGQRHDRSG
jgi:hypothetical protein